LRLDRKYFDEAVKTVKPYLDAGKLKSFSGETAILPGITARPTPGHKSVIPADAIARAIAFAIKQLEDVDVNEIVVRPLCSSG
jgi:hypothetical protein